MSVSRSEPPTRSLQTGHPGKSERDQYRDYSKRIEQAYGAAAFSVSVESKIEGPYLTLGLTVLNRAGHVLSPRVEADYAELGDLIEQSGQLLGSGQWLLEGKRSKPEKQTTPRGGWKKNPEMDDDDEG